MPTLTVEQILQGTTTGRRQAVGQMAVIPILGEGDGGFAPPTNLEAGTRNYGELHVRNRADRPTIVPTGAAWITPEAAQDHAAPGASLVGAGASKSISNAYCVQETQGGLIRQQERNFVILPAPLRSFALANRNGGSYDSMWPHIREFKRSMGLNGSGNLVDFLKRFERELDQFVAEFELVPRQVGALILIAGKVVGIERAPDATFWNALWEPLIRVCYGSLALRVAGRGAGVPSTRAPLGVTVRSLEGISQALEQAAQATKQMVTTTVAALGPKALESAPADETLGAASVLTLASRDYAGQVVSQRGQPVYASICAAAA